MNDTQRIKSYVQIGLILILIFYWGFVHLMPSEYGDKPAFYHSWRSDPESAYALSSLGPFIGQEYTYIDHPGTPVQMIGSAIYFFSKPFVHATGEDFIAFHIENQWLFLLIARAFLLLFSIICLLLLFRLAFPIKTRSDILIAAAISMSFYAFLPNAFVSLIFWSHNSFAFPFGTLLLLITYLVIRKSENLSWRSLWLLGSLAGVLTSVQLYFATWVMAIMMIVFFLMIFERRAWWLAFVAPIQVGFASLIGFGIATWPIRNHYDRLYEWVIAIISHQGRYGQGAEGVISVDSIQTSVTLFFEGESLFSIITLLIVLAIGLLIFLQRKTFYQQPKLYAVLIGLYLHMIIMIAAVVKHPSNSYLVAITALFPMLMTTSFEALRGWHYGQRLAIFVSLFVWAATGYTFTIALMDHVEYLNTVDRNIVQYQTALDELISDSDDERILLTAGMASRCDYLWFGNVWTELQFTQEIYKICPNRLFYGIHEQNLLLSDNQLIRLRHINFPWDVLMLPERVVKEHGAYGIPVNVPSAVSDLRYFLNPNQLSAYTLHDIRLEFEYSYGDSTGWHQPELYDNNYNYQWMSETESTLSLNLNEESDYEITFRVFGFGANDYQDDIALAVNGMAIPLTTEDDAVYTGTLPQDAINPHGAETFTFKVDSLTNLLELGYNDTRTIGAAFDWLEIRSIKP